MIMDVQQFIAPGEASASLRRIYFYLETTAGAPATGITSPTIGVSRDGGTYGPGNGTFSSVSNGDGEYYYEAHADEVAIAGKLNLLVIKAGVTKPTAVRVVVGRGMDNINRMLFTTDNKVLAESTGLISGEVVNSTASNALVASFELTEACLWTNTLDLTTLVSTGWTQFLLAIKTSADNDDDSAALVMAKVSNPADAGDDGLVISNGRPAADKTQAAIVVSSITPNTLIGWTLSARAMALLPNTGSDRYYWDLYRYKSTAGSRVRIAGGRIKILRAVWRDPEPIA